jgi:prevent-host-death family protein
MQTLPLHLFRAQLAQTLDLVMKGERVRVTRHGVEVIELRPVQPVKHEAPPMWKRALKPHPLSKSTKTNSAVANPMLDERNEARY